MRVDTESRPSRLGKRVITICSIDINNKPIKDQKSLMGLMLGIYVSDSLFLQGFILFECVFVIHL